MSKAKKEICYHCGQSINKEVWLKHTKKKLTQQGLPSLAKLLQWAESPHLPKKSLSATKDK